MRMTDFSYPTRADTDQRAVATTVNRKHVLFRTRTGDPSLPCFAGVTRVHARSLVTQFPLHMGLVETLEMRRETTRVSFLMCPFCVRPLLTYRTTDPAPAPDRTLPDALGS